jgi:transcriptional regulator of acetoin/glycerol metabolism
MARKTPAMLLAETRWRQPAEDAIVAALNAHGSLGAAADALGIPRSTLRFWMGLLGIDFDAPAPTARLLVRAG